MTPLEVVILVIYVLALGGPLGLAWWMFLEKGRTRLGRSRRNLTIAGLLGISVSFVAFFGMLIHARVIGGLYDHWGIYRAWSEPGTLLALISTWFLLAGAGWSRMVGIAAGLLALFFWYVAGMAM
jgi:hypothetical protein